jgi:hypothetical protein
MNADWTDTDDLREAMDSPEKDPAARRRCLDTHTHTYTLTIYTRGVNIRCRQLLSIPFPRPRHAPRSTSPSVPRNPTLIPPSPLCRILATGAKGTEPIPGITRGALGLEWEGGERDTVHMASTTENTQFPFLDDDPKTLSILVLFYCFLISVYTIVFLFLFKHGHISPAG